MNKSTDEHIVRHYTPEFKAEALAMMEEKGAVATIHELGISSYTLYDWKKKAEGKQYVAGKGGARPGQARKRYTPEFKAEVIATYQKFGQGPTLQKYGIVNNTLYNWLNEAGVELVGNRGNSDHSAAIALYNEKGLDAVLAEYNIKKATLYGWLREAGITPDRRLKYSPEIREKAKSMMKTMKLIDVSRALGIPATTLINWREKG